MATVPGQLIWEIVKKNNSFLVKEFGNGTQSVQFSREPNNLYNLNTYKYSDMHNNSVQEEMKDHCYYPLPGSDSSSAAKANLSNEEKEGTSSCQEHNISEDYASYQGKKVHLNKYVLGGAILASANSILLGYAMLINLQEEKVAIKEVCFKLFHFLWKEQRKKWEWKSGLPCQIVLTHVDHALSNDDKGPVIDAVVWNDGKVWRVALDTQSLEDDPDCGKLANFVLLTN